MGQKTHNTEEQGGLPREPPPPQAPGLIHLRLGGRTRLVDTRKDLPPKPLEGTRGEYRWRSLPAKDFATGPKSQVLETKVEPHRMIEN